MAITIRELPLFTQDKLLIGICISYNLEWRKHHSKGGVAMFRCPLCGASARIRTSRPENDSNTVRQSITNVTT